VEVVDSADVLVADLARDLYFVVEAFNRPFIDADLRPDKLEGNFLVELGVVGTVDPAPNSSMISYRPAKSVPRASSSTRVSSVRVKETCSLVPAGKGVAHSSQNLESAGLIVSHLGHFIAARVPPH